MKNLIVITLTIFNFQFSIFNCVAQQTQPEFYIQYGHTSQIKSLTFSPDGKFILSTSNDKSFKLWDVQSGKEIRSFDGHTSDVSCVKFSSDGKTVNSVCGDGTLKTWDIYTGIQKKSSDNHKGYDFFSPDGKTAVAFTSVVLQLHDAETGKELFSFKEVDDWSIHVVAISPNGKYIVSGSDKRKGRGFQIKVWDITTGQLVNTFKGQISREYVDLLKTITFTRDSKTVIAGLGPEVAFWDITSGKKLKTINFNHEVELVACTPDGKNIIVAHVSTDILDIESGKKVRELNGFTYILNLAFAPDGKTIAASNYNTFALWDISTGKKIRQISRLTSYFSVFGYFPDGKTAFTNKDLWNIDAACHISRLPSEEIEIISPDGKVAIGDVAGNSINFLNMPDGSFIKYIMGNEKIVCCPKFYPNGKMVLFQTEDKKIKLLDIESEKEIKSFIESSRCDNVEFLADGKHFITQADNGKLKLWDIEQSTPIKTYERSDAINSLYGHSYRSFIVSPNGKYVVSDDSLKVWDIATGELKNNLFKYSGVYSLAFSADGKNIITAADDNTIRIWDFNSGKNLKTIKSDLVQKVIFTPQGNTALSITTDNKLKLWNIETGELIYTIVASFNEWLVYNEDGYWDGSSDAESLVAMVKGLDSWNIDQFAVRKNRPDLILKKNPNADPDLIAHYYNQYLKRLRKLNLTEDKLSKDFETPETKITKTTINDKNATIDFSITSATAKIIRYNVFVNDVPVFGAYGKEISSGSKSLTLSETVELTTNENKIEVSAMNEYGAESFRALTSANYNPITPVKPNLYYIGFGVSKYKNTELNLQFADKDAKDLSEICEKMRETGAYSNVYSKTYLNEEVTPKSIKEAKDFLKDAKPDDTFVLFIAGHGTHDSDKDATYYYLTSNTDPNNLKGTAVDFETIEDLLQGIPPRNKLFLMDACESGEIDEEDQGQMIATATGVGIASRGFKKVEVSDQKTAVTTNVIANLAPKRSYLYQKDRYIYNDLVRRSGAIVFSSSKGGELSYERSDIENGLFTEYIMKALTTTEADKNGDGLVSTDELREYVSAQVAKASGDLQHPTVDRDNIYQKFSFR